MRIEMFAFLPSLVQYCSTTQREFNIHDVFDFREGIIIVFISLFYSFSIWIVAYCCHLVDAYRTSDLQQLESHLSETHKNIYESGWLQISLQVEPITALVSPEEKALANQRILKSRWLVKNLDFLKNTF